MASASEIITQIGKISSNYLQAKKKDALDAYDNRKQKYYIHIIVAILVLLLGLFYYLNDNQNIFNIKNSVYEIFMWLFLIAFCIHTFRYYVIKHNTQNYQNFTPEYDFITMYKYIGLLFLIILFPVLTINFILYLHKTNNDIFNVTQTILGVLIVIVIFAIIAKIFSIKSSSIKKPEDSSAEKASQNPLQSIITLLIDIIFFIPCLLIILVDEINKDIRLTPSSIYLLFFILLILVTLIFLLPIVFKYLAKLNKNDVLSGEGPFYLNEKKTLGKYQNLDKNVAANVAIPKFGTLNLENAPLANNMNNILSNFKTTFTSSPSTTPTNPENNSNENTSNEEIIRNHYYNGKNNISDNTKGYDFKLFKNDLNGQYNIGANYYNSLKINGKFPYNYTYSISFYIYINPQPTNTSIAYNKDTELFNYGCKPVIYYNGNSRKIIIKSRTINNKLDQLDTIYEMTNVKHQKWLYFVINYENNNIDVFIDGKLVGAKNNITPYFIGDSVTIGEDDGIYGSIKEIFYFDKIKTPDSIQFLYSLTKNNNLI
jgi:flagellar basal body-associated protein FliL